MNPEIPIINGKQYPLWSGFVAKKDQFVGGILQEFDLDHWIETTITDIVLEPNGENSAFFRVVGKDFSCGFDCQTGGLVVGDEGRITFMGYGGHTWRIKEKMQGVKI